MAQLLSTQEPRCCAVTERGILSYETQKQAPVERQSLPNTDTKKKQAHITHHRRMSSTYSKRQDGKGIHAYTYACTPVSEDHGPSFRRRGREESEYRKSP